MPIRVIVCTSEPLLALALNSLLDSQWDIQLAAVIPAGDQVAHHPGVAGADVALVALSADVHWDAVVELRRLSPHTKILLWAEHMATEFAHQALIFGVRGILRRSVSTEMLLTCIRQVHAGELWFEKSMTDVFLAGRTIRLSRRESELVKLLARGLKNKEIATVMNISEGTVKVYLSKLFDKVGAKDRFELAIFGLKNLQIGPSVIPDTIPIRSLFVHGSQSPPLATNDAGGVLRLQ
jgi:DNA-binding NarL/FixJ family response regulator